jgi:molybdenum cofactor cytidylyltransferase
MDSVNQYNIDNCAVVIIAAGESKRLGLPKQLLLLDNDSMLNRLIKKVQKAVDFPIYLVLGANVEKIKAQLPNTNLNIVENNEWQEGMGSSIRIGVQTVIDSTNKHDGVLILVCDQPHLSEAAIQDLVSLQAAKKTAITASFYANIAGTPALFHASIFPDLLALKGDQGAKKIIQERVQDLAKLQFEKGVLDIDTQDDYQQLLKEVSKQ